MTHVTFTWIGTAEQIWDASSVKKEIAKEILLSMESNHHDLESLIVK